MCVPMLSTPGINANQSHPFCPWFIIASLIRKPPKFSKVGLQLTNDPISSLGMRPRSSSFKGHTLRIQIIQNCMEIASCSQNKCNSFWIRPNSPQDSDKYVRSKSGTFVRQGSGELYGNRMPEFKNGLIFASKSVSITYIGHNFWVC